MPNIIRFFIRPNSPFWAIPKSQYQMIGADSSKATPQERTLIANQYARNVVEAQILMTKYKTQDAQKIMQLIGRKKPTVMQRLKRGVKRFVMKIEGSTAQGVIYKDKYR